MNNTEVVIDVSHVTIQFNLGSQKVDNLKEYVIKILKKELMFQEFLAVRDVSFCVHKGEAWGLIGTNGSGKSTLLKAISGILKPYKGSIEVKGSIAPLIELGAGFDGEMTARENIFLNGCVLGHSEKFMAEHFDEIVAFAELKKFLDMPIKNYSSGMKARLGFSVATMVKPDILIVDEILSVGDMKFRQKCNERMDAMLSGGTTLLYVSHSLDEVRRLCDHVLWIEKGEAKMAGNTDEVCNAYESYMQGR
jgi:lipopolysaccharide transport system ATP-binding protein